MTYASYIILFLISIIVHELGHVIMLRYRGCRTEVVLKRSWSTPIVVRAEVGDARTMITAAIAGPFAGFLFGLAILPYDLLLSFCIMFLSGIFQLMPIPGSDGYHILQTIRKENNV